MSSASVHSSSSCSCEILEFPLSAFCFFPDCVVLAKGLSGCDAFLCSLCSCFVCVCATFLFFVTLVLFLSSFPLPSDSLDGLGCDFSPLFLCAAFPRFFLLVGESSVDDWSGDVSSAAAGDSEDDRTSGFLLNALATGLVLSGVCFLDLRVEVFSGLLCFWGTVSTCNILVAAWCLCLELVLLPGSSGLLIVSTGDSGELVGLTVALSRLRAGALTFLRGTGASLMLAVGHCLRPGNT